MSVEAADVADRLDGSPGNGPGQPGRLAVEARHEHSAALIQIAQSGVLDSSCVVQGRETAGQNWSGWARRLLTELLPSPAFPKSLAAADSRAWKRRRGSGLRLLAAAEGSTEV